MSSKFCFSCLYGKQTSPKGSVLDLGHAVLIHGIIITGIKLSTESLSYMIEEFTIQVGTLRGSSS